MAKANAGWVEWVSGTAVWYHAGLPVVPIRWLLVRDPAGHFEAQAFLSTDPDLEPRPILEWFIQRWPVEVTFEEAWAPLGIETQRQWSDRAIARTTAWSAKKHPTFSDTLAWVRRWLWGHKDYSTSPESTVMVKIPRALFERLTDTVCYAA